MFSVVIWWTQNLHVPTASQQETPSHILILLSTLEDLSCLFHPGGMAAASKKEASWDTISLGVVNCDRKDVSCETKLYKSILGLCVWIYMCVEHL
jgi:hypothetical protein